MQPPDRTTDDEDLGLTLGRRLDATGRRLADRHRTAPAWVGLLAPVVARTERLAVPHARFDREESPLGPGHSPPSAWLPVPAGGTAVPVGLRPEAGPTPSAGGGTAGVSSRPNVDPEPGRPLPKDVRSVLRAVSGPGADALRVHDGVGSDRLARSASADAVTTGRDVHLRSGRGRPDEPAGLALLAHEAIHVSAALDPAGGARRSRPGGPIAEEEAARAGELQAMRTVEGASVGPDRRSAAPPEAAPPPGLSAAPPGAVPQASAMTAAVDRELPAPVSAPLDVEELRRGLVEDLMRQLRSEFERGA